MNFAKGALLGMMTGAIIGAMNHDSFMTLFKRGKKEIRKMQRKYDMQ